MYGLDPNDFFAGEKGRVFSLTKKKAMGPTWPKAVCVKIIVRRGIRWEKEKKLARSNFWRSLLQIKYEILSKTHFLVLTWEVKADWAFWGDYLRWLKAEDLIIFFIINTKWHFYQGDILA